MKRRAEVDNAHARKSLRDGINLIRSCPRAYPSPMAPLSLGPSTSAQGGRPKAGTSLASSPRQSAVEGCGTPGRPAYHGLVGPLCFTGDRPPRPRPEAQANKRNLVLIMFLLFECLPECYYLPLPSLQPHDLIETLRITKSSVHSTIY